MARHSKAKAGVTKYFDPQNKVTLQKVNNPKAKTDKSE